MDPLNPLSYLPTDNLYKFGAISGIVIILLSLFFPMFFEINYNDFYSEKLLETEFKKFSIDSELEDLENDLNSLKINQKIHLNQYYEFESALTYDRSDSLIKRKKAKEVLELRNISENLKGLQKRKSKLKKSINELEASILSIQGNYDRNNSYYKTIVNISPWGILLGLIAMATFFCLWFLRLQKYQDKIIKNESEKLPEKKI
jgi:hypothetical protein